MPVNNQWAEIYDGVEIYDIRYRTRVGNSYSCPFT